MHSTEDSICTLGSQRQIAFVFRLQIRSGCIDLDMKFKQIGRYLIAGFLLFLQEWRNCTDLRLDFRFITVVDIFLTSLLLFKSLRHQLWEQHLFFKALLKPQKQKRKSKAKSLFIHCAAHC